MLFIIIIIIIIIIKGFGYSHLGNIVHSISRLYKKYHVLSGGINLFKAEA